MSQGLKTKFQKQDGANRLNPSLHYPRCQGLWLITCYLPQCPRQLALDMIETASHIPGRRLLETSESRDRTEFHMNTPFIDKEFQPGMKKWASHSITVMACIKINITSDCFK